eukprot:gene10599-12989_t
MSEPLLRVENVGVSYGKTVALADISLDLDRGGRLALIGESGSGKSTLAMAIAGLLPKQARQTGSIVFPGTSDRPRLGRDIGVVFQDPGGSLDPVMRVGDQIAEVIRAHEDTSWIAARVRAADLMDRVRIPKLVREDGLTLLFVTHDIALASERADQIAVLYKGQLVERGTAADVLGQPAHPYTKALIGAHLSLDTPRQRRLPERAMSETDNSIVLEVKDVAKRFGERNASGLKNIGFTLRRGETLALVGASGSGKTTLARLVMRLGNPDAGSIRLCGHDITALRGEALRLLRPRFQMVFQDPLAAFNPRATVRRILEDPLRLHDLAPRDNYGQLIAAALERVGLSPDLIGETERVLAAPQAEATRVLIDAVPRLQVPAA